MARRKVSKAFRSRLSEKLMELGNLIAISMIVGQFVSQKEILVSALIVGFILTILCYTLSYLISP